MTRPARGQGRGNRGTGRSRHRGRQGRGEVEDRRLLRVQSVNRQRGTKWQQNPNPPRCEDGRRLIFNQEGLRV
jgi:hypothetical protein